MGIPIKTVLLLMAILGLASSCINSQVDQPLNLDAEISADPFIAPYLTRFVYDDSELMFVASDHSHTPGSPNLKTIASAFSLFKPTILIVEGYETRLGYSHPGVIAQTELCNDAIGTSGCSEIDFAIGEALSSNTPFIGAEPSPADEFEYMVNASSEQYSLEDYVGLQVARTLVQLARGSGAEDDVIKQNLEHLFSYLQKATPELQTFTRQRYLDWCAAKLIRSDCLSFHEEDLVPRVSSETNIIQEMSYHSLGARDHSLLEVINTQRNKGEPRILIVFGSSHLSVLRGELSKGARDMESVKVF